MARWRTGLAAVAVAGLLAAGCGGAPARPTADPQKARQALTAALEGWRKGQKELTFEGQPVTLRDERFTTGGKLVSYKLGEEQAYGYDRQFKVAMTVGNKQGQSRTEQATYNVRTDPAVVISRLEDD
jgi:hypothetical protein